MPRCDERRQRGKRALRFVARFVDFADGQNVRPQHSGRPPSGGVAK